MRESIAATKIICVGFSVTEMPSSYTVAASRICVEKELPYEIHRCGIGGIGIDTLVYIFADILEMHKEVDDFVLELATGDARNRFHGENKTVNNMTLFRYVEGIILEARKRNKKIGFLNLPRGDIDYSSDALELAILSACNLYRVPVSSVTHKFISSGLNFDDYLSDGVHVNDEGANFYAEELIALLACGLAVPSGHIGRPVEFDNYLIGSSSQRSKFIFERHGYGVLMTAFDCGDAEVFNAPEGKMIYGFTHLSGPGSGLLEYQLYDGDKITNISLYDQYCYYTRFNSKFFSNPCKYLRIKIGGNAPNIQLLKGEFDPSPRVAYLGHLLLQ